MLYSRLSDVKINNTCIVPLKKKKKASKQQQQQQQKNEQNYKIVLVWVIDIRPLAPLVSCINIRRVQLQKTVSLNLNGSRTIKFSVL